MAARVEIETSPTPFRPDGPITELVVSFRTDASDRHLSASLPMTHNSLIDPHYRRADAFSKTSPFL
ncbi:hypothetical protein E4U23_005097 [Claviceps purpurea]|nr:hypothetical protein E4U23_005097 [Claviceps purpurea]